MTWDLFIDHDKMFFWKHCHWQTATSRTMMKQLGSLVLIRAATSRVASNTKHKDKSWKPENQLNSLDVNPKSGYKYRCCDECFCCSLPQYNCMIAQTEAYRLWHLHFCFDIACWCRTLSASNHGRPELNDIRCQMSNEDTKAIVDYTIQLHVRTHLGVLFSDKANHKQTISLQWLLWTNKWTSRTLFSITAERNGWRWWCCVCVVMWHQPSFIAVPLGN